MVELFTFKKNQFIQTHHIVSLKKIWHSLEVFFALMIILSIPTVKKVYLAITLQFFVVELYILIKNQFIQNHQSVFLLTTQHVKEGFYLLMIALSTQILQIVHS
jgi:hypothetical protein